MYNGLLKIPWSTALQNGRFFNLNLPNLKNYHNKVKNFYNVLKIKPEATHAEVKEAYYKLSKQYHPDLVSGNEQLFKAISEAYSTLGNVEKRRAYDDYMFLSERSRRDVNRPPGSDRPEPWHWTPGPPPPPPGGRNGFEEWLYRDGPPWREWPSKANQTEDERRKESIENMRRWHRNQAYKTMSPQLKTARIIQFLITLYLIHLFFSVF